MNNRFYYAHGVIWDTEKPNGINGISINDLDKGLRIVNWLYELHEQNKQLQSMINDYDNALKKLQDLTERKLKENERLKLDMIDIEKRADNVYDENKDLKQQVLKLELENDGLNYALKYIRKIDVEVNVE